MAAEGSGQIGAASSERRLSRIERSRIARMLRALLAIVAGALLAGCDGPPDRTPKVDAADAQRGLQVVVEKGCAACHTFPDVDWPRGGLGPALAGFGRQSLIAGRLPNQPGVLIRFVRNAPALVPGIAMPAIPMSDQEALDVTAYLVTLESR